MGVIICLALTVPTLAFSQFQKGTVPANGIEIAYESVGPADGEAIILIQGTGAQLSLWPVELCEELADHGYRVIRFDNQDVGLSTKLDSLGPPDWVAIFPKIVARDTSILPIPGMAHDPPQPLVPKITEAFLLAVEQ